jgi:predicted patatin/cPLA2 family phospholipase
MEDLFIGGGGFSGIMFIGVLEYLHENNLLDLKNFYGCSIGSLIGILYLSGFKPKEILSKILELNLKEIVKYDLYNISNNHIIDDDFLDKLISFVFELNPENITIFEFSKKTKVNINIHVTKLNTNEYISFNNTDYPNIKLKDALKASMSIPFIFKSVNIDEGEYIDGCCKNVYGSPVDDVYICGYSIIVNYLEDTYFDKVFRTLLNFDRPRSTFIIECKIELNPGVYLNLDKLENNLVIDMYKKGILYAKEQLR